MASPTQEDINIRLQLAGIEMSQLINIYANNLKWGKKCNNLQTILLLNAYIEIVQDYDIDSTSNCITEDQLNSVFDKISSLANLCFSPYSNPVGEITKEFEEGSSFDFQDGEDYDFQ